MTADTITAFKIRATDAELADLQARLKNTRWPEAQTPDDWTQGIPRDYLKDVCTYWANGYDWRSREANLNRFDQFTTPLRTAHSESKTAKPSTSTLFISAHPTRMPNR